MLATIQFRTFRLLVCRLKTAEIKIYRTIILRIVLYGCETLREEHGLRVFENRVLRRMFGPKTDNKHDYNDQIQDGMGRACSTHGR
jgi:hypothetical protein